MSNRRFKIKRSQRDSIRLGFKALGTNDNSLRLITAVVLEFSSNDLPSQLNFMLQPHAIVDYKCCNTSRGFRNTKYTACKVIEPKQTVFYMKKPQNNAAKNQVNIIIVDNSVESVDNYGLKRHFMRF